MIDRKRIETNLDFARTTGLRSCGVCGLPTLTDLMETYCSACHKLLCVTCQDGHVCNFGPPVEETMRTITPNPDGGQCTRCHSLSPGSREKVFFISSNPSLSFGVPDAPDLAGPSTSYEVSCGRCLTDEEIAHLLKPVAFWVLDVFCRSGVNVEVLGRARAWLHAQTFPEASRAREKALEALGINQ